MREKVTRVLDDNPSEKVALLAAAQHLLKTTPPCPRPVWGALRCRFSDQVDAVVFVPEVSPITG